MVFLLHTFPNKLSLYLCVFKVAGINYKVKVKVAAEMGVEECIHVLIYCPLPHTGEGPKVSIRARHFALTCE